MTKIVIPVLDKEARKFVVAESLGMESHVCIYDLVTRQIQWIDVAEYVADSRDLVQMFKDLGVKAVVFNGQQSALLQNLKQRGIAAYKSKTDDLIETIKQYNQNKLVIWDMEDFSLSSRYANRMHRYRYSVAI